MRVSCPHCRSPVETPPGAAEEIVCPSCGSSFRVEEISTPAWSAGDRGQKLGRFEIIETLGAGSFGTVYKARDPQLDRVVALKVPRLNSLDSAGSLERFLREARTVAQLNHPKIVAVHEVGESAGVPFLVCDFVPGLTLADYLSGHRPDIREAARLIAEVADGLACAHQQGVIHRDVKPSNIMLERPAEAAAVGAAGAGTPPKDPFSPKLMDFGLAKRDAGEATMTTEGQVLGTPAYMSPEQARGESHQVDGRSDIYSLGVILYQVLTGELPFRGTARMLLYQVLHEEPRPPRQLNDRVPVDLETICLKALAKEPPRRYQTAAELAADLRRFLAGEPILARPTGRWVRVLRWVKRRPAVAALLVVSAVAALASVGFAVGLVYNRQLAEAHAGEEKERKRAEDALAQAQRYLYFNGILLAEREWFANNAARARQLLDDCPVEQRGWEWHYLKRLTHSHLAVWKGHQGTIWDVALSPDSRFIASAGQDKKVLLWDRVAGRILFTLEGHRDPVHAVAFSRDGQYLASASGIFNAPGEVIVWNATTGEKVRTFAGQTGTGGAVAFSPDSRRLAVGSGEMKPASQIKVWDLATGKQLVSRQHPGRGVRSLTYSSDGKLLIGAIGTREIDAFGEKAEGVQIWDAATGKELDVLHGHTQPLVCMAASPDGRWLASGGWDRTVLCGTRSAAVPCTRCVPTARPSTRSPSVPIASVWRRRARMRPPRSGTWPRVRNC